jgi:endonuclease/exonuclease/phosphatase family metal-dependent hydrolase
LPDEIDVRSFQRMALVDSVFQVVFAKILLKKIMLQNKQIEPSILTVITWNIHRRSVAVLDPLAALTPRPDVVTLQEVTLGQAAAICEQLHNMGYSTVYSCHPKWEKDYGNVIDARTRMEFCDLAAFGFPIPQLAALVKVDTPNGSIRVLTIHVPNGTAYGWKKIDTFDALKRVVLKMKGQPLILTGDFNEPYWGLQDGHIVTFGQDKRVGDRWLAVGTSTECGVTDSCERWDAAVRWFFESPNESGLRVAFWDVAGHGKMAISHRTRGNEPRRWFDHMFVSSDFRVQACKYLHTFRTRGFSDHSPLIATLSYAPD